MSGVKWILAVKITITSTLSSLAGGTLGIVYSIVTKQGKTDVMLCINGILGGLASVMASCASVTNLESILIGAVGALLVILASKLLIHLKYGILTVKIVPLVLSGLTTPLERVQCTE